jgi:hypothetical protein
MDNYKYLTLSNNVILIGKLEKEESDFYILKKPYMIVTNGESVMLIPYMADLISQNVDTCKITKNQVISIIEANNTEILQTYIKEITGIETPDNQLILG